MIWCVYDSDYDYFDIKGYFNDLKEAYKYCAVTGFKIHPIEEINFECKYDNNDFVYSLEVTYIQRHGKYERTNYCSETSWRCYLKNVQYELVDFKHSGPGRVIFDIRLFDRDAEKAFEIADQYMEEVLNYGNGKVTTNALWEFYKKHS